MTEYEVCQQNTMACEQEIAKGIIGQKDVIRQVMLALLAGGNVLLEGMPGLGKTMLVRTISQVCDLSFQKLCLKIRGFINSHCLNNMHIIITDVFKLFCDQAFRLNLQNIFE